MTKLEQLYNSIQNLKELGVQLPDKLIEETNRVEEEIIKNDIIPALADTISPVIGQIKREIILVVEYVPDEPLVVYLTRKKTISATTKPEPIGNKSKEFTERQSFTISSHNKSSKTVLSIKFPDGQTISHRFAYETLMDCINRIGVEKVRTLNMTFCGVPLVAGKRDDFYTQHELSSGVYIMTHSSTQTKRAQLEEISKRLGLGLKIDIVE